jgi:hypothetical protein
MHECVFLNRIIFLIKQNKKQPFINLNGCFFIFRRIKINKPSNKQLFN